MDRFEAAFARRLQTELDSVDARMPAAGSASLRPRSAPAVGILRPLGLALAAALGLAGLATAVTQSPDPGRWVQPSVWMRALGGAPALSSPTPTIQPAEAAPSGPPRTTTAVAGGPEREPADTAAPTPGEHESPEPHDSVVASPSRTGSSPPQYEGPDG